jgi:cation diffusion facilitator family transporter
MAKTMKSKQTTKSTSLENATRLTVISLVILGIIQIILGETISKSVALTANGIDCIGDGFVSFIVWIGLVYIRRPADHKFHYGYYKVENLAAIAAAIVMFVLAGYILYRSYNELIHPHEISLPILGAVVALIATIIAWVLGGMKYLKAKRNNLGSLKLDAFNTIKDGTASFLTVIALVLAANGFEIADAIVGFIIACIIISIGYTSIKEASYVLVDACDASCIDIRPLITDLAQEEDSVKTAHIVRLRRTGPVMQGELEIDVPGNMTVKELYKLRIRMEERIKKQVPDLDKLSIIAHPENEEENTKS